MASFIRSAILLLLCILPIIVRSSSSLDVKKEWTSGSHHRTGLGAVKKPRYRTLYACEGNSLEIQCEPGTHINLIRANFGRFSISVCNEHGNMEWSVDCMSHRSFKVIQDRCADRSSCAIDASVATFGEDACPKVHKYVEVHFNCTAPRAPGSAPKTGPRPELAALQPGRFNKSDESSAELDVVQHSSHPTLSPLPLFPEPSKDSTTSTTTPVPQQQKPFNHDIDLSKFDNKEAEEAVAAAGSHSNFQDQMSAVRPPPSPMDYTAEDSSDDTMSGEDTPVVEELNNQEQASFAIQTTSSTTVSPVKPIRSNFDSSPIQTPTARPPKPHHFDGNFNENTVPVNHADNEHIDETEVVVLPPIDMLYDHCHPMYSKRLNWNWTMAGRVLQQPCPDGAEGVARWSCIMEGAMPTWSPPMPDMSNCSSPWVTHLVNRIHSHRDSVLTLAEELAKGSKSKYMFSGDLIRAADIVKQLVTRLETLLEENKDDDQERRANIIRELLNFVLNVASNLLDDMQMESWHELSAIDQRSAIGSMTGALESVAQMLAEVRSQPNYNYVRTHNNILVSVHVHSLGALENGLKLPLILNQHDHHSPLNMAPADQVSAYLPYEALVEHANEMGQVKVIFVFYRRLSNLLKPRGPSSVYEPHHLVPNTQDNILGPIHDQSVPIPVSAQTIVNSDIVGLIISDSHRSSYDRLYTPLSAPVELTLRHIQVDNVTNGRCAFWDIKRNDWSTSGCETVSSNRTHTTCRCNHLTNFAVLMDVSGVEMGPVDRAALKAITRIGCAISIIALILTFVTLSCYKSLKSIRNSIHKNLCACLIIAELIFLFGIDETRVKLVCGLIAISLHYFFLAAFLWMFFEGLQLYTMLVQVFEHRPNRLTYYSLIAYGAPAILVIVAALVDPLSYGTASHCWLRTDNHFIWSFLGPALAVLIANALFLGIAMSILCRHHQTPAGMMTTTTFAVQNKQHPAQLKVYPSALTATPTYTVAERNKISTIRVWVRTSMALVVVLGLTWTFGVFYLSRSTIISAYIFTVLNSLQGLFIFIFCCLLNEKVRQEWRSSISRGARRCFLLRPFNSSNLSNFGTKSSTDSTRSTSLRDSHHLMMANGPHHLSQQHLYMQQPAASFLGSRNAGPRTSLLYLNEMLGKSEAPTAVSTPTTDQPLIGASQILSQNAAQDKLTPLQQAQLSQALSSLSQIQLPDDTSSDYGCRRLTQMMEHIYECIDEDPYVAKLLLPAIERSLTNHQARLSGTKTLQMNNHQTQIPATILATLGRASQRDLAKSMPRLQPNSSYLSANSHPVHGGVSSMHLPAIVRDNTQQHSILQMQQNMQMNIQMSQQQQQQQQSQQQQFHPNMQQGYEHDHLEMTPANAQIASAHHPIMINQLKAATQHRAHLASEC